MMSLLLEQVIVQNASIVTDIKENVLAINEALIQYDNKSKKPFVEVQIADQKFERRDIEIGVLRWSIC